MVSEEDWTWNGLWWRLDLKWSLMKTGLEMVSNEDWAWNGLGSMNRSETISSPVFIRDHFKSSLHQRPFQVQSSSDHFKFNLHKTISSSIFIRPFQVQSSSDHFKSSLHQRPYVMRIWVIDLFILKQGLMKQWKQSFELEMVLWRLNLKWSDEDWTWNGLMKIELEMVLWRLNLKWSDEDWTWNDHFKSNLLQRPFQVQSSSIRDHFKSSLH
jgi:hypothetical protein